MVKYLLIPVVLYYSCFIFQQLWVSYDAAVYLILARSLAQGRGYIDHFLSSPKVNLLNPPGYPSILSLSIRVFGDNLLVLRIFTILVMALSLFILTKILAKYLNKKEIIWVFLLFSLNRYTMGFVNTINSECVYFLFSWATILYFSHQQNIISPKKLIYGALLIISAFYMRVIGISLYLSFIAYLWLNKKYRQVFLILVMGLLMFPWLVTLFSKQTGYGHFLWVKDTYTPSLSVLRAWEIPWRLFSNLKYYSGKVVGDLVFFPYLGELTFGSQFFAAKIVLSLLFSLLFFKGFYSSIKNKISLLEIYIFVYFLLILFWPYHSERFLLPIFPFLLTYLLISLRKIRFRILSALIVLIPLIVAIAANYELVKFSLNKNQCGQPCFAESYSWVEKNTPKEAIIMSEDPAGLYFNTQRRGVFFELNPDPVKSFIKIKEQRINYLLLRGQSILAINGKKISAVERYIKPLIEKYPSRISLVYQGLHKCEPLIYRVNRW